ncbi:MAG: RNA polymerase-binding transcription factor DksA [Bacteriovoracaceae bacterium]|jgi:RNA polymerase-binding transcription factor DksA
MNFKQALKQVQMIETEINNIERDILMKGKIILGVPQDQISDFGDLCLADEIVHSQVLNRKLQLKRLSTLNKSRSILTEYEFIKSCNECGDSIDPRRLSVRPHASRCIHCKNDYEEERLQFTGLHKAPIRKYA